ncbi:MAG: indolepyruvate ferredoxin oxidoreductase subunit alpha [Negativicutes bacterium]|nr:indolepyruvate ferredoxin oxidoreductase subunit alpha [Negativicutes bacterium]
MKKLMSGNEAIARGFYEAGGHAATAYPGTPSTEILEHISQYPEIYSEWSVNEKVAVEVAQGFSMAGARSLAAMKHVGVNVAADPLFTMAYSGVNGGFVLVSADDPGMHSSQDEQDNRYYARFMKMLLLEPSDSQEAKQMVIDGLEMSEKLDLPVILRTTTRISHSQGLVELGERKEVGLRSYEKRPDKFVMMPANARRLRVTLDQRLAEAGEFSETYPGNRVIPGDGKFAVITSGIAYQYAREVFGQQATYLKLSMTNPAPRKMITDFISRHDNVLVIEEGEPFLEEQIKFWGLKVTGKERLPAVGELSAAIIAERILGGQKYSPAVNAVEGLPQRPPVMCPACPHRGVYFLLAKKKPIITGDIGCYTLGALPPLNAMDTCICMGASITAAIGIKQMLPDRKVVATIGDSTFLHSGLTGLVDAIYKKSNIVVLILDNHITGMTGHQQNPATGLTIRNNPTNRVVIEDVVKACGVENVQVVDAYDLAAVESALDQALAADRLSVIIARRACALIVKDKGKPYWIDSDKCKRCRACMRIGCPAISYADNLVSIDGNICNACGVCRQMCKFGALQEG